MVWEDPLLPSVLSVLVVDSKLEDLAGVHGMLGDLEPQVRVQTARTLRAALDVLREPGVRCIVSESHLQDASGIRIVRALRDTAPGTPLVILTGMPSIDAAVVAMRHGAFHYMLKGPEARVRLPAIVREAVGQAVLVGLDDAADANRVPRACADVEAIVATTPRMRRLLGLVERVANSNVPVLIQGETGTGKELLARAIHERGRHRTAPLLVQNCAALAESLLESELFGHVRGAFTGAERDRRGLFDEAGDGTVFLDEIGDAPLSVQAKLLRVLQNGEVKPVGADRPHRVRARVVAATNRRLDNDVRVGRFREDLFFRLSAFPIVVPPLRHRAADVAPLVERALGRLEAAEGRSTGGVDPAAMRLLQEYPWPGNVRELEHEIHRLVLTVPPGGRIRPSDLSPRIGRRCRDVDEPLPLALARVELALIQDRLRRCASKTAAARSLGITREALYAKLRRLGNITMSDDA